ncbi:hypothetical protein D3C81_1975990 [compost metagenome]
MLIQLMDDSRLVAGALVERFFQAGDNRPQQIDADDLIFGGPFQEVIPELGNHQGEHDYASAGSRILDNPVNAFGCMYEGSAL